MVLELSILYFDENHVILLNVFAQTNQHFLVLDCELAIGFSLKMDVFELDSLEVLSFEQLNAFWVV